MNKGFSIFVIIGITIISLSIIYSYHPDYYANQSINSAWVDEEEEEVLDVFIRKQLRVLPEDLTPEEYSNIGYILECLGTKNMEILEGLLEREDDAEEEIETFLKLHLYEDQLVWLGV